MQQNSDARTNHAVNCEISGIECFKRLPMEVQADRGGNLEGVNMEQAGYNGWEKAFIRYIGTCPRLKLKRSIH
jgi:hypothetical protein